MRADNNQLIQSYLDEIYGSFFSEPRTDASAFKRQFTTPVTGLEVNTVQSLQRRFTKPVFPPLKLVNSLQGRNRLKAGLPAVNHGVMREDNRRRNVQQRSLSTQGVRSVCKNPPYHQWLVFRGTVCL